MRPPFFAPTVLSTITPLSRGTGATAAKGRPARDTNETFLISWHRGASRGAVTAEFESWILVSFLVFLSVL
jgi:hypothetical protein